MPVRYYMVLDRVTPAAFDYAFYPSDLYYADVAQRDGSFDDWNARKDGFHAGYFGEVRGEKNKQTRSTTTRSTTAPRWPSAVGRSARPRRSRRSPPSRWPMRTARPRRESAGLRRAAFVHVPGWVDARGRDGRLGAQLPAGWTASEALSAAPTRNTRRRPPTRSISSPPLNEGASLVRPRRTRQRTTAGTELSVRRRPEELRNADRLPVVISAGCSHGAVRPAAALRGLRGRPRQGTRGHRRRRSLQRPAAPAVALCQTGRYNPTGLGETTAPADGPTGRSPTSAATPAASRAA